MEPSDGALVAVANLRLMRQPHVGTPYSDIVAQSKKLRRTSDIRLQASQTDAPVNIQKLFQDASRDSLPNDTVLYLGYGSNLSAETFLGRRNIKPISQINVVVPEIALTFNLPGIPYSEPCFANSRYREPPSEKQQTSADYHKDHWHKGLVGVVYEVTRKDYVHIIATEGGGSGYQDVVVDCYALSANPKDKVPSEPSTQSFKAHTLFAPFDVRDGRPDPSYAQPSARYLKLITDGAAEHNLPYEYQDFLHQIRAFHLTTTKQRLGQFLFTMIWAPIFLFIFRGPASIFLGPDGRFPPWFQKFARAVFMACWASYDGFFKPLFGDGERSIGDGGDDLGQDGKLNEKAPLIKDTIERYGIGGSLETMV